MPDEATPGAGRPASITRFERLYGAAMLCGGTSTALDWRYWEASVEAGHHWLLAAGCAAWLAMRLALWAAAMWRPAPWVRWAVTALAVVALLRLLFNVMALIVDATPSLPAIIAGTASAALHIVAAAYLFRRDSRPWFAEERGMEKEVQA